MFKQHVLTTIVVNLLCIFILYIAYIYYSITFTFATAGRYIIKVILQKTLVITAQFADRVKTTLSSDFTVENCIEKSTMSESALAGFKLHNHVLTLNFYNH